MCCLFPLFSSYTHLNVDLYISRPLLFQKNIHSILPTPRKKNQRKGRIYTSAPIPIPTT